MVIAIGVAAAFMVYISNRNASRRMGRVDKAGLAVYAQKAQREETFPFDYLSR
jgi:hypothetical protein